MNRNRGGIQTSLSVTFVVGLTFAMRIAACRESFWLDELHTAWAVADSFEAVASRAGVGNQTAAYFQMMWGWCRVFGTGEVAMRASSVLASCLAASLLVWGVRKQTESPLAGLVAGMLFAMEPNSVFFGSELRPYAWVMLCSVLAVSATMSSIRSLQPTDRNTRRGRDRFFVVVWVCVACLLHPTSLGTLGWLLPITYLVPSFSGHLRFRKWDALALATISVTCMMVLTSSLSNAWQHREQWSSFASAHSFAQLLTIWEYGPLVGWPAGVVATGWGLCFFLSPESPGEKRPSQLAFAWIPMAMALATTGAFFLASYYDVVPLWHRRYFIAVVPLMAWSVGELFAWMSHKAHRHPLLVVTLAVVCVVGQASLLYRFGIGRSAWPIWRFENWRDGVSLVANLKADEASVWLDSGLIETQFLRKPPQETRPLSELESEYLRFPLLGPYRVGGAIPPAIQVCSVVEHDARLKDRLERISGGGGEEIWLISRSSPALIVRYLDRIQGLAGGEHEVHSRSRPAIVRIRIPSESRDGDAVPNTAERSR